MLLLLAVGAGAQTTGVFREVFASISGVAVGDLTNHTSYPFGPSAEGFTGAFESPTDVAENYGQRMRALVTAPTTGDYRLWIASDDASVLLLSTSTNPADAVAVARVDGWTPSRDWTIEAGQQSAAIPLLAGQSYYFEALMKEGGGGDNLCVRWQLPDGTFEEPIPGSRLTPVGMEPPVLTAQPADQPVEESSTAVFDVAVQRPLGVTYQWRRNGVSLAGATESRLSWGPVALTNNGAFSCVLSNAYGAVTSHTAVVVVFPDWTPPTVADAQWLGDGLLQLRFSEAVAAAGATNRANYVFAAGLGVTRVWLADDGRGVLFAVTGLTAQTSFAVTVSGVRDRATVPNTIMANTPVLVSTVCDPLPVERVRGSVEAPGPSSRRTPLAITELMYHPPPRADGRALEFIELYNSGEIAEDLGGFRLSGEVDFAIPAGVTLGAREYLVIAAVPAEVRATYGITNVIGGFVKRLADGGGTVRLRGRMDEVLLEAVYDDAPPFPAAADGAGHSLVLARPSWGERHPRAWAASARSGGSPGGPDPVPAGAWRTVVLNEWLTHTDEPQQDMIELFNYGTNAINLAGCVLTDDPATNKFIVPAGTILAAGGFAAYTQAQLGFALDAGGERIILREPDGTNVIDAVRAAPQANGVPVGRQPDGAPDFCALATPTPGGPNAVRLLCNVVINEIMYHPLGGNRRDEYVEVYNRGPAAMDLTGWRLSGGASYVFPTGATIAAHGYAVIAADGARLLTNHPGLVADRVFGPLAGSLSDAGDRLSLQMPEELISTNSLGRLETNGVHIAVDEVAFGTGGRWGGWSDGGGSSLERTDARADPRRPDAWADSDETAKGAWVTVEQTGVLDLGYDGFEASALQVLMLGAGECLVDRVEVIPEGGANVVANGSFDGGVGGVNARGSHEDTGWAATAGEGGGGALHVRATGRGDTGVNSVTLPLTAPVASYSTATLRARVRWLKGCPEILLRLRGNWLEATGTVATAALALGTPGAANSRAESNAGPAITDVVHFPVVPAADEAVTVVARFEDPDGVTIPRLNYRIDPAVAATTVGMTRRGAGYFSAEIPGQPDGTLVAFWIEAADAASPAARRGFPAGAPAREALVRFGDATPAGGFGTYRFWATQAVVDRWAARDKNSNRPLAATFVYGGERPVHGAGVLYSGSPFHIGGYDSPVGQVCDYVLGVPGDDPVLGATDFLIQAGGGDAVSNSDGTALRQQIGYWMAGRIGVPYLHRRYVHLLFNGLQRGLIMEDAQQPSGDHLAEFYPDDDDGRLFKIEDWFEFQDDGLNFGIVTASLEDFQSAGVRKAARYRWCWRPRAVKVGANDFSALFELVDVMNAARPEPYTTRVTQAVDVREWMRAMALHRMVGNWDAYGYGRGKNMYAYKPEAGRWTLIPWDIDFCFGHGDGTTADLSGAHDPVIAVFKTHPPFARLWWNAMRELAVGPMTAGLVDPRIDAMYAAFQANGVGAWDPGEVKTWIADRRAYILAQLADVTSGFGVDGPVAFTTNANYLAMTGTAPVEADRITVNGIAFTPGWTSLNQWSIPVLLSEGTNELTVAGLAADGAVLTNAPVRLTVISRVPPLGTLWLNEAVLTNANGATDAAGGHEPWVEIHNAGTTAVSTAGWFLSDDPGQLQRWAFPSNGTVAAGGFLVVWLDGDTVESTTAAPHASFRPSAGPVTLTLARTISNFTFVADAMTVPSGSVDRAYGSFPDGAVPDRRWLRRSTPGAPNDGSMPSLTAWVNEWMADNATTCADPADGQFEDWFELHNPTSEIMDLDGAWLADDAVATNRFQIPAGFVIPPRGHLLVWADGEAQQNAPSTRADLHVNFKLSKSGDAIHLLAADESVVDSVTFGLQATDGSEGRRPDGGAAISVLPWATPGAPNPDPEGNATPRFGSVLPVVGGGGMACVLETVAGRRYQLEYRDSLLTGSWQALGEAQTAVYGTLEFRDAGGVTQRFYRVLEVP